MDLTAEQIEGLNELSKKYPNHLVQMFTELSDSKDGTLIEVWRSKTFLVQVFKEKNNVFRMSVNRTEYDPELKRWKDGITWDELMDLKRQAGMGYLEAVEVYPPDRDIVDVANMRHLWFLPDKLDFAWRNK